MRTRTGGSRGAAPSLNPQLQSPELRPKPEQLFPSPTRVLFASPQLPALYQHSGVTKSQAEVA